MEYERISRVVIWRLVLGTGLLFVAAACGSTGGCQGCTPQPIPGGFNQQHRFNNAMQVRLSSSGIDFMEANFEDLVSTLVPGGLSFDIPPSGCSTDQKVCCSGPPCSINMNITNVTITPTPKSTAKLALRAAIKTINDITFSIKVLFYTLECKAKFDTGASGKSDLGLNADINLVVDANDNNKLKINRGTTTLVDFDSGDIEISGGFDCTIASWFKSLFKGTLEDQLMGTVDDTLDAMLKDLPLGQEGQFNMASVMSSFSPRTTGVMDYFIWTGGYAEAENAGMSVGVMGGFRPTKHNSCVPNCEAPGATCQAPQKLAIPRSQVFRANSRPNGQPYDVGIGVHRHTLDVAAYAMYASGGLCLDIDTMTVSQLSSSLFALLVPSLNTLTGGKNVPMMLAIRPRKPPTVTLGKGTYHKDTSGKIVIDDPLLKIQAKDFAIDVFAMVDERLIRIFTVVGDLELPVLLFPDAQGNLQPILGDLTKALTNATVENSELLKEDPVALAGLFPTLIGLAGSFLGSGFQPIELPALQGIQLQLGDGSITTTDTNTVLAIFANLAMVKTTSGTLGDASSVDTDAKLAGLTVPETGAFQVGPAFAPFGGPSVTLELGARLPPALAGQAVEYSYRVDRGFFHPFSEEQRVVVRDPVLWLQGHHSVEVMARVKGQPATLDPTPVRVSFTIDTVPPVVKLVRTTTGVRVEVEDAVTTPDAVQLSWSVGGAAFGPFGDVRHLDVPASTDVRVQARDEAGNVTRADLVLGQVAIGSGERENEGGCSVALSPAPAGGLSLLLLALALVIRRRGR